MVLNFLFSLTAESILILLMYVAPVQCETHSHATVPFQIYIAFSNMFWIDYKRICEVFDDVNDHNFMIQLDKAQVAKARYNPL